LYCLLHFAANTQTNCSIQSRVEVWGGKYSVWYNIGTKSSLDQAEIGSS